MSREERRQRERQMKSMERGGGLPPAARARAERNAARRAARRGSSAGAAGSPRRYWIRGSVVAIAAGFLAFSFQWPNLPFALYVGLAVTAAVFVVLLAFRRFRPRSTAP